MHRLHERNIAPRDKGHISLKSLFFHQGGGNFSWSFFPCQIWGMVWGGHNDFFFHFEIKKRRQLSYLGTLQLSPDKFSHFFFRSKGAVDIERDNFLEGDGATVVKFFFCLR